MHFFEEFFQLEKWAACMMFKTERIWIREKPMPGNGGPHVKWVLNEAGWAKGEAML